MSNVLVISGHPNLEQSNTNQIILNAIADELANVEIRKLDTLYPDYNINVEAEQTALLGADIIILQFPFYWYSVPALLKKWIDDVFAYGFAYGSEGNKLQNKQLILSFTIGGPKESYDPLGYNHFPITQLLQPLQQTAYLTGMNFLEPVFSHGMVYIPGVYNTLEDVQDKAQAHAKNLIQRISSLQEINGAYVERFARGWFSTLDKMPASTEHLSKHLADNVVWSMPEGEFVGKHGFNEWYDIVKRQFKSNCNHQIQALSVNETPTGFLVELTVNLVAETFEDSIFNGDKVDLLVHEKWHLSVDNSNKHLSVDNSNKLLIDEYKVELA